MTSTETNRLTRKDELHESPTEEKSGPREARPAEQARPAPGIDRSLEAEASSAQARINVPLNLHNWRDLEPEVQAQLTWLHQHLLDEKMTWDQAEAALDYDRSTIYRVLRGMYEGS